MCMQELTPEFREDVRAVLPVFLKRAYDLKDSSESHFDVSSFDAARWAVDFVEELHKQLKEKGRI